MAKEEVKCNIDCKLQKDGVCSDFSNIKECEIREERLHEMGSAGLAPHKFVHLMEKAYAKSARGWMSLGICGVCGEPKYLHQIGGDYFEIICECGIAYSVLEAV